MPNAYADTSGLINGVTPADVPSIKPLFDNLDAALVGFRDGTNQFNQIRTAAAGATVQIVADQLTISRSYHVIDVEGGAASSDNLTNILGGNDGDILILQIANSGRAVVANNSGNIRTPTARDVRMNDANKIYALKNNAGTWHFIALPDPTEMCSLTLTTSQSVPHNTITAISFASGVSSENFDTDAMHNPSVNPTRVTVNTAGVYAITGLVQFDVNGTGLRRVYISKNGASLTPDGGVGSAVGTIFQGATRIELCGAGDYFELRAYQNSGSALDVVGSGTHLTVARIA